MQQTRKTPTFNMKAVVRETGIRPDTLRAWERRYELPNPDRTAGGHRIYSQRDVDILRWLLARQDEGLSISHAVELFKRLEEEGQDPILTSRLGRPGAAGEAQPALSGGDTIQEMRDAWLTACRSFDEPAADRILSQAFAMFPPEQVCVEVLQKGIAAIGQDWYDGGTSVQQEHFASALALRRLETMLSAVPVANQPGRILLGCPPGEEHTFGPMMLAYLLRRRGLDIVYLGANVPIEQLAATLAAVRPRLAIFLSQQLVSAATLWDLAGFLSEEKVPLAFGGRIFVDAPELQRKIGGHYLGDELIEGVTAAEKFFTHSEATLPPEQVPTPYHAALFHLQSRLVNLEAALTNALVDQGQSPARFVSASDYLTRNVLAALKLGDMDLVAAEIEWVGGLMGSRDLDQGLLQTYLVAYRQALVDTLDHRGQLIVDWFESLGN